MKENWCFEKKRVGSTRKRVRSNGTQQYIHGDDSRYTVKDGEVSLLKTVANKSIRKNSKVIWRRVNSSVNRGNRTTAGVKLTQNQAFG